jgi:WD40 repeat protein
MKGLRLLPAGPGEGHQGEVFSCAYTADGSFVLSAGWDGYLRLWDTSSARVVTALQASAKPLSACAVSPDGRHWLSGSLDGVLSVWDSVTHQCRQTGVVHIRPISAIRFAPDGQTVATASWDRQVMIRKVGCTRDGKTLSAHTDIVAGCAFAPDGRQLVSWSYDGTVCLWDVDSGRCQHVFQAHADRAVAAALSPDGRCLASASRGGQLKLWDLAMRTQVAAIPMPEPRGCYFLLDAQTLAVAHADGQVSLLAVPSLEAEGEVDIGVKVHAAALAPSGEQLALGGEDGRVHLLAVDGTDDTPLVVTPARTLKARKTVLGRFFGGPRLAPIFQFTCPGCRHVCELDQLPPDSFRCTSCQRLLRADGGVRELQLR